MSSAEAKTPGRVARIAVAVVIGAAGASVHYIRFRVMPNHPGDFGMAWFGARSLLHGIDPYPLVGPGRAYDWPWHLLYPATSFVAAMPFALLPQLAGTLLFVFVSCALLAYSVTRDGWEKMPMFGSAAFIVAAGAAQWSPLFTAAFGLPILGLFFVAKPTIGLALAAAGDWPLQKYVVIGGVVLTGASLVLFPEWPSAWLDQLRYTSHIAAPFARPGGFVILLALLRWRRSDARLILLLACVPQAGAWYEMLPLFLVPVGSRETMLLAAVSSAGFVLHDHMMPGRTELEINQLGGTFMVALGYLPAVIMVLRRPNEGGPPLWLTRIARWIRPQWKGGGR